MPRIPSQLPTNAAPTRRPLPSLSEGFNLIAGQINRTPAMGKLWSILNVATPSVGTAQTRALPQGQIDFQEVSGSSDEDCHLACGGDEQLQPGELSALELESTRNALAILKDEHARQPEGDARSHYQAQIAKLESALHSQGQATSTAVEMLDVQTATTCQAEAAYIAPVVELPPEPQPVRAEQAMAIVPAAQRTMTSALVELGEAVGRVIALPSLALVKHTSNDRTLLPRNVPTFNTLGQSAAMEAAGNSLRANLLRWGSAQVQSLNVKLAHQIALKEKANRTPEPAPYTKLERACLVDASTSPLRRVMKPTSDTTIKKLLEQSNPDAGSYGALHCAVVSNHPKRLETLLRASAGKIDVDMKSEVYGATGLELAVERGYWQCTEVLLRAGARPTLRVFVMQAEDGNVDRFRRLHAHWQALERKDARARGATEEVDFRAALGTAVEFNALDIARYLLEQGVRPRGQGYLMLQFAAEKGHAAMLRLLLDHVPPGIAYPPSESNPEQSPLAFAMQGGYVEAVSVLLQENADPQFVRAVTDSFEAATTQLPRADKERLAPVTTLLRSWLQQPQQHPASDTATGPALLALHGEAANDPRAGDALPSKHSRKVFAPSYVFSRPLAM
ncbi:ankyrin repeat domain-containing protein [Stenotrophomonas sp. AB1(2024)]|uniref:ankyrin repeat domain-containing protein n=1 Tax=Stenotrophomonas sp. AB1(2024) TaxID=3132215 RepID=UPI00309A8277